MKLFLSLTALFFAVAIKLQAQSDLIARIHFLGAQKISTDTNSRAFTNEFCSTEARALENQTLEKLSRAPGIWFKSKLPAGADDGSAQLRPLLDDLLESEWIFEIRATNGFQEYTLAVRLNDSRARLWQNNLQNLLESWTKIPTRKIPDGWELKKHLPPDLIRFERDGDFVVIDCGENQLSLADKVLDPFINLHPVKQEANWLSTDLNWPRLAQLFPSLIKIDLPKTEMKVVGRDGNLLLNGKIILSQPISPFDKWEFPTNLVHQPLVSFTAARGFASRLEKWSFVQPYGISPPPDQIFIWALAGIPFQTFAATPVPNASAALSQLDKKLSSNMNWKSHFLSPFTLVETNRQIIFGGVPFIAPNVAAIHEKSGDFLLAGFFPNSPRSKPLPAELFAQLATPNLVYYHWEITAERLPELQNLCQLGLVLTRHKQLESDSAGQKWINHIGPTLGNTVTKITETTPDELAFSRKAPGGLTALELFAFASWLEATNFPGCDLSLPPPHFKNRKIAAPPGMP